MFQHLHQAFQFFILENYFEMKLQQKLQQNVKGVWELPPPSPWCMNPLTWRGSIWHLLGFQLQCLEEGADWHTGGMGLQANPGIQHPCSQHGQAHGFAASSAHPAWAAHASTGMTVAAAGQPFGLSIDIKKAQA